VREAEVDRIRRKGVIAFFAGEPFFLRRGSDYPVRDETSCAIVIECGNPQNVSGFQQATRGKLGLGIETKLGRRCTRASAAYSPDSPNDEFRRAESLTLALHMEREKPDD
jgi:hypothetical protein